MAAVESGEALFNKYSEVSEEDGGWLTLRDIVLSRKMPRRMLVQPLTVIEGSHVVLSYISIRAFEQRTLYVITGEPEDEAKHCACYSMTLVVC